MGSWALLWPPLLFTGLLVRPPGTTAQAQYCSVNKDIFEVEENTNVTEPLVDIHVPEGQEVTLGPLSTPFAFRIQGNQLFLNVTPDYEENSLLEAQLLCQSGGTLVTQLRVFVSVLDVNDNAPEFPFKTKEIRVEEDTEVNSTVIPETQLQAEDRDKGASDYFSLVSVNRPALRLDRPLDFYERPNMTFWLLVRDTPGENVEPSHTATATLVLHVVPADLRPPWFLPCTFSDGYVCIQAQYHGAVPTGHILPSPLVLRPGPIYAEDGDRGINQPIIYSIFRGNVNGTFIIHPDSGNLTVARSVPSPMTFLLLVKGQQADLARYSVTQVTVEAVAAAGSPPRFPQSLYRGTVVRGAGAGVVVKDAAAPSQPLRIQAQDPEFSVGSTSKADACRPHWQPSCCPGSLGPPGLPSVGGSGLYVGGSLAGDSMRPCPGPQLGHHISNYQPLTLPDGGRGCADHHHTGTGGSLLRRGAGQGRRASPRVWGLKMCPGGTSPFLPQVEANNTVTSGTATTVIEIQVSEQEPPSTDVPPSPEAGGTTGPWTSTTSEAPRPPAPSQGPSTTSSGGGTGPHPPSGTTLRPPTSSTPGGPPGAENSTSHQPATPGGDTAQTPKPGTSQPMPPGVGTSTSHQPATPGGGTAQTPEPGTSQPMPVSKSTPSSGGGPSEDKRFSVVDMAALGGVLGALLLLALLGLAVLVHKHYGPRLKCCSGKAPEPQPQGFDNQAFLPDHKANWAPVPSPTHDPKPVEAPMPAEPAPPGPASPGGAPEPPAAARAGGSPTAVRSILTKERRPEGGYKAVWFGEDIGAEADVVVLNAPTLDMDGTSDSGSGDEGAGRAGGPYDAPGGDDSYI
ncbi:cadherin-related family member 5 isoform X3 [Pan troglodytes]|uniref:cadherin-related family member 5 isoform X3 n=1 Tax=Pan troglodytes TaxID=9598 RepID=UPI0023F04E6D|nr:cadherin-related family member 5 isoform X3 [Pan troglodytes]